MSAFEQILLLTGAGIGLLPIAVMLGARLIDNWKKEDEK